MTFAFSFHLLCQYSRSAPYSSFAPLGQCASPPPIPPSSSLQPTWHSPPHQSSKKPTLMSLIWPKASMDFYCHQVTRLLEPEANRPTADRWSCCSLAAETSLGWPQLPSLPSCQPSPVSICLTFSTILIPSALLFPHLLSNLLIYGIPIPSPPLKILQSLTQTLLTLQLFEIIPSPDAHGNLFCYYLYRCV